MIAHGPRDARIEKLISRLRSKLEPGLAPSQRLLTMRGRGCRLAQGGERCGWLVVGDWLLVLGCWGTQQQSSVPTA